MIDDFINNVFCRRESNQIKAKRLWNKIKENSTLNTKTITDFEIEWSHYLLGEYNPNDFAFFIQSLKDEINGKNK